MDVAQYLPDATLVWTVCKYQTFNLAPFRALRGQDQLSVDLKAKDNIVADPNHY